MRMMKAWVVERWGSLDDLVLKDIPRPKAGDDTVVVRVSKAALNFADGIAVRGRYQVKIQPPFVLGSEIAGVVAEASPGSGYSPGDRVLAQVAAGAFGEYCPVETSRLVRLPDELPFAAAAALPVSYTTAHVGLFAKGNLKGSETVLVHAAAGGLGLAATQLATWRGARVIATAGSDEKCRLALDSGAAHAINYRDAQWPERVRELAPDGVDMVFDPVGGETSLLSIRQLAWGGRLMLAGFASGAPAQLPANHLLVKAASAIGVFWSFDKEAAIVSAIQKQLVELAIDGHVRPHLWRLIDLADLRQGMSALESGETTGKVIINVAEI
jgi:NADPH:quinone reductase